MVGQFFASTIRSRGNQLDDHLGIIALFVISAGMLVFVGKRLRIPIKGGFIVVVAINVLAIVAWVIIVSSNSFGSLKLFYMLYFGGEILAIILFIRETFFASHSTAFSFEQGLGTIEVSPHTSESHSPTGEIQDAIVAIRNASKNREILEEE